MKIALIYGLNCSKTSNGGGLLILAQDLRDRGHEVQIFEWKDKPQNGYFDVVIGHSFGGETAIRYGNANPSCVVIVLDPVPQNWMPFLWRLHPFTCNARRVFCFFVTSWDLFPAQKVVAATDATTVVSYNLDPKLTHNSLRGDVELRNELLAMVVTLGAA